MIYPRMDIFLFRYICCIDIFLFWICNFLDLNISFLYLHDVYIFGLYRIYHFREYLQKDISFFGYIRKKCIKIGNLRKFMKFLWIYPNWIYPKINISIKFIVDISIKDISFKYRELSKWSLPIVGAMWITYFWTFFKKITRFEILFFGSWRYYNDTARPE